MCNEEGESIWERTLNSFGKAIKGDNGACPFMYQGQYYDEEIELAYNRFRYYSPDSGTYISQDPIQYWSGELNFYAYVSDTNILIDIFGLTAEVYKLTATKSGYYDVYEFGTDTPVGKTWLNEGDTYKIGETADFRTRKDGSKVQNRYSKKSLDAQNLEYKRLQHSPNKSAKKSFQKFETSRIKKFEKQFGKRPAGNKCYH